MGKKLKKEKCEVCGEKDRSCLEEHHIIERTQIGTSNSWLNIAILCANCHSKIHFGELKIIGVFPSTELLNGRSLVYELDGVCNVDGIDGVYWQTQAKNMKVPERKYGKEKI